MAETSDVELPEQLRSLALHVDEKPESLATNDKTLAETALAATKYLFDLGARQSYTIVLICLHATQA